MRLSEEVPKNYAQPIVRGAAPSDPALGEWKGYIRIQRTKAERRANRLAGKAARRKAQEGGH